MIAEKALALAGADAHLVCRPAGVAHVYTGPLTPSGRFVPRAARTVCRTHTRRLRVLPLPERRTSLDCTPAAALPRLCARCTACLDRNHERSRQATPRCSRDHWLAEHVDTTKADISFALELAVTPDEVDAAAWLSLLLFDVAGCNDPFVERGRTWPSLHHLVHVHRGRVGGFPESLAKETERGRDMQRLAADQRRRERKELWQERQDRIARLGISNAARRTP